MNAKVKYMIAVFIYGTIGMILRAISLPSELVVLCRGLIGSLFILVYCFLTHKTIDKEAIAKNIRPLILSGISLGLNWVFLFMSYKETTVAVGSLCNYLAPIMVIVIMAISKKSCLTPLKTVCVIGALAGVFLISGGVSLNASAINFKGLTFGMMAAFGFVALIIFNKQIEGISCYDKAIVQLFVSACTVAPYVIVNNLNKPIHPDSVSLLLIGLLGMVHTGIAYLFYFDSMPKLELESIAVLGYLEPVVSVLSSVFVLNEKMDIYGWIGAVMILLCALICELPKKQKTAG